MPNHWETSARPLFVKTVFVNGNRHAILSEEDPLLRCGKKISRPNSSLSFSSDLSTTFSDSQTSSSEDKSSKLRNTVQEKDLSSDLQSCLVKLKLASGSLEIPNKPTTEKCLCTQNSKELKRNQSKDKGNSKQKRHKWNHERNCRKKHREQYSDESKEYKGRKNNPENSCYVYNLENFKGKKKYCFVKISSQPPQFILNCCCEKNWNETHSYNPYDKNNLVISATIHNLVMSTEGNENLLRKTFDYVFPFQNAELHWPNNYLTKSYYNSLSDRVFQWLDLARKRKTQKEKLDETDENEPANNNIERIFSGKTFMGEKIEISGKQESRILMNKKNEKITQNEDIEGEVVGEPHVETLVSKQKLNLQDCFSPRKPFGFQNISDQKIHTKEYFPTKNSKDMNLPISNTILSPLKIQDLLLNFDVTDQNKIKTKECRNLSPHQNKFKQTENEERDLLIPTMHSWEKRISQENTSPDKFDTSTQCQFNRNLDEIGDKIKNPILTEEFAERNQKSINNLNITRTRPVLIQNLLSPQQPQKACYSEEEKIVWASEKNTGRPQLHIFMPSVLRKDHSDDSISECESFLNS